MEGIISEVITKIITDPQNINRYTEQIKQLSNDPIFTRALLNIVSGQNDDQVKTQAIIIFKNHVKNHWMNHRSDESALIPNEVKQDIRNEILKIPFTGNATFSETLGNAIALIARYDYPMSWPEFLPTIAARLHSSNKQEVLSSLNCFNLVVGLTDFRYIVELYSSLSPAIQQFCQNYSQYQEVALNAAQIFRSFCYAFGSHPQEKQTTIFLNELPHYINMCVAALNDTNMYGLILAARIIGDVSTYFPASLSPYTNVFNATLNALKVLHSISVSGSFSEVQHEGIIISPGAAVYEIFQYLEEMFSRKASERAVSEIASAHLNEFINIIVSFLQITEADEDEWMIDITAFVLSESSFGCVPDSPRVNAQNLLNALCASVHIGEATLKAIQDIAAGTIIGNLGNQSNNTWWRLVEAALVAIGIYANQIQSLVDECEAEGKPVPEFASSSPFLSSLSTDVLTKMIGMNLPPLLLGRVLIVSSQICSYIKEALQFFEYAVSACTSDDMLARVCGCQALSVFVKRAPESAVLNHINVIVPSLLNFINESSEDLLSFAIETLASIAKSVPSCADALEEVVSPLVIKIWTEHNSDPLSAISAAELLEAVIKSPQTTKSARAKLLKPMISTILAASANDYGIVTSGLTFIETLIRGGKVDGTPAPLELDDTVAVAQLIQKITSEQDASNINSILILIPDIVKAGKTHLNEASNGMSLLDSTEAMLRYVVSHLSDIYTGIGRVMNEFTQHFYVDPAFLGWLWHATLEAAIGNLIESDEPYRGLLSALAKCIGDLVFKLGVSSFTTYCASLPTVHGGQAVTAAYQIFVIGSYFNTFDNLAKKTTVAVIPQICEFLKAYDDIGIQYYDIDEELVSMPLTQALLALLADTALSGDEVDDEWMDLDEMIGCEFYDDEASAIDKDHPLFKADIGELIVDSVNKMKVISPEKFQYLEPERSSALLE